MWWIAALGCGVDRDLVVQAFQVAGDYEVLDRSAFTSAEDLGYPSLPGDPVRRVTPRGQTWEVRPAAPIDGFDAFSIAPDLDPPAVSIDECEGGPCFGIANVWYRAPVRRDGILREDLGGFWYTEDTGGCTAGVAWTVFDPHPDDGDLRIELWSAVVARDVPVRSGEECFRPEVSEAALDTEPWVVIHLEEITAARAGA
jgi:hypothetical protein